MIGKIFLIIVIIAALGTSLYLVYLIYQDNYPPVRSFNINYTQLESQPSYPDYELQFFPNMRFDHNNISYAADSSCSTERVDKLKRAFSILQSKVEVISFFEETAKPDISVNCSNESIEEEMNTFIAGSGGAEGKIPFTGMFYIIPKGEVTLYEDINCDFPDVEVHEVLHVLGFNHSASQSSVMYPISSCKQVITSDITDELIRLYSIPALPDLYFENISGTKRGNYVNLNFSLKNQGLKDSGNLSVILYGNNKEIIRKEITSIEPGSGIIYSVQNIRTSSNSLNMVVQNGEELNERNNHAELILN